MHTNLYAVGSGYTLEHAPRFEAVTTGTWSVGDVVEWAGSAANAGVIRSIRALPSGNDIISVTFQSPPYSGAYPQAGDALENTTQTLSGSIAEMLTAAPDFVREHGSAKSRYALLGADRPYPLLAPLDPYRAQLLEAFRGATGVLGGDLYGDHSTLGLPGARFGDMRAVATISAGFAEISRRLQYRGARLSLSSQQTGLRYLSVNVGELDDPIERNAIAFDTIDEDLGGWVEENPITGALRFRVPPRVSRISMALRIKDHLNVDPDLAETTRLTIRRGGEDPSKASYPGAHYQAEWSQWSAVMVPNVPTRYGETFDAHFGRDPSITVATRGISVAEFVIRADELL